MANIRSLHHAALTVPTQRLEEARCFYSGLLGLQEAPRPDAELSRPGIWYRLGTTELHIQCRDGAVPQDADYHPALLVDDLGGLKAHLRANDVEITDAAPLFDRERFFCRDPFGNRLEFMTLPS